MKTLLGVVGPVLFAGLVVSPVHAQQPTPGTDPHHPAPSTGATADPAPAPSTPPKPGEMSRMNMCHQMMAEMTGMPMRGGAAAGPKERAEMLQMRGEMMKHARHMQAAPAK